MNQRSGRGASIGICLAREGQLITSNEFFEGVEFAKTRSGEIEEGKQRKREQIKAIKVAHLLAKETNALLRKEKAILRKEKERLKELEKKEKAKNCSEIKQGRNTRLRKGKSQRRYMGWKERSC